MVRRNSQDADVADETTVEPAAPVLPPGLVDEPAVDEPAVDEPAVNEPAVNEQPAIEPPPIEPPPAEESADAGSDREPDPTPAVDRSELVLAAIRRGIPSYKAWAMSDAELTGRQEA